MSNILKYTFQDLSWTSRVARIAEQVNAQVSQGKFASFAGHWMDQFALAYDEVSWHYDGTGFISFMANLHKDDRVGANKPDMLNSKHTFWRENLIVPMLFKAEDLSLIYRPGAPCTTYLVKVGYILCRSKNTMKFEVLAATKEDCFDRVFDEWLNQDRLAGRWCVESITKVTAYPSGIHCSGDVTDEFVNYTGDIDTTQCPKEAA